MNLDPLRRLQSKLSLAFVTAAALVLASCGGGGATSSPTSVGALQLLPGTSSLYAGVPYTFNIVGGRRPYLVTSSEPTLVALNFTTDGPTFSIVPNNPGVVDVGLDPNEVPRRTVNIEVRDSNGVAISNAYNVLQNFFTGYGESYTSTCASSGTTVPQACSGTDTIVSLFPVSNGALYGNREFQLDRVRGDFSFVQEPPGDNPQLLNTIRTRTDQQGRAFVRIRVAINAPTQLATYRVTDISTGVTTDLVFLIVQQAPVGAISVVPGGTITFTGSNGACGFGSSDQFIFDGAPPYVLTPPASSAITVTPTVVNANGDKFTVSVGQGAPVNNCPSGPIVIIDSQGRRATIQVNSIVGGTAPPIAVAPVPIDLRNSCPAGTGQAAIIGGGGPLSVISNHPRVSAVISGNILSVLRVSSGDGAVIYPAVATLVVTDGLTLFTVSVTGVAINCP